jgi:hypothetical protein
MQNPKAATRGLFSLPQHLPCLSPLQDQDTRRDGEDLKKKSESSNA